MINDPSTSTPVAPQPQLDALPGRVVVPVTVSTNPTLQAIEKDKALLIMVVVIAAGLMDLLTGSHLGTQVDQCLMSAGIGAMANKASRSSITMPGTGADVDGDGK